MEVPGFTRDERRNPIWQVPALVQVERMDNSMAMTLHIGNIKSKGGKFPITGDVCLAIGGFVLVVSLEDKKRGSRRYAINLQGFISDLINSGDEKMCEVPKLPAPPLPKDKAAKRGTKRGRK